MTDARDARFYSLQKKAKTTLENLSPAELQEYLQYAKRMTACVRSKLARKQWIDLSRDIDECLNKSHK